MSTDQVLLGVALIVTLAAGAQVLAQRLRIPALILYLLFGFVAGASTDVVNPTQIFGTAFTPLVELAVALILYDAGMGLDLRRLKGHTRTVVQRLIAIGVPVTFAGAALSAALLFGMSNSAAMMLGAILVVSGPTVVQPLLEAIRPQERIQHILSWEGSLIDPIGAILGAVVFTVASAQTKVGGGRQLGEFVLSLSVGLVGGAVGLALLWLLLRGSDLGMVIGSAVQVALVIAVAALCDVVRDDSGLIAAIIMGLSVANIPAFHTPARRPFSEILVPLILGLLFVSISATVTPASLNHLLLPTLGLVAVLVLVVRPIVAAVSTWHTDLTRGQRAMIGWMAPRGIVAASTASTFGAALAAKGVRGAGDILPVTFMVIVATVTLYGLTAAPVARRLGVVRPTHSRPLFVGGEAWVVELARALRGAGFDVLISAGTPEERDRVKRAGFDQPPADALASAIDGVPIEGVTMVLLLTLDGDFNSLASTLVWDTVDGSVFHTGPSGAGYGVVAPFKRDGRLFGLTAAAIAERVQGGAQIVTRSAASGVPPGDELLFVVDSERRLLPVTADERPETGPADTLVLLTG